MDVLFAGVPVARFDSAVDWYGRLFGRAADIVAHDREVMWRVADGGWLYVVEDAGHAGRTVLSISVPDLDEAIRELSARGINARTVEKVGEVSRKMTLLDPDGNRVALIEVAQ